MNWRLARMLLRLIRTIMIAQNVILHRILSVLKYAFLLPLFFLGSCSCYKFGAPGQAALPFCTLYVAPIANKTFIPQAQALLWEQVIRFLQQSGIDITQCEEFADATLSIELNKYIQNAFTTRSSDTTLASSFVVILEANCTLIDNKSCEPYFVNNKIITTINAEANDSVQRVLYQDMPVLTEKLANKIRNLVVGAW